MDSLVYSLNVQLDSITDSTLLLSWITNTLIPFMSKETTSKSAEDSLIVNVLKKATTLNNVEAIKRLIGYVCELCGRFGTCNVLWHFGEWIDSVQGMIFETKIEIPPAVKANIRELIIEHVDKYKEVILNDVLINSISIKLIHYLNLHLFLTEADSTQKSILTFFIEHISKINGVISKNPGIRVKLFTTLNNIITKTELVSPKAYTTMCSLLIDNDLFTEVFTIVTNSFNDMQVRFSEREKAIRCSVILNYCLAFIVYGILREGYDWTKVAALYHQFFDAKKEHIIRLMSISDSSLISFLLHITVLASVTETKSIALFKTQWIPLEYLLFMISQYGIEEWCEISINYLLEDVQYLEFMIQLLGYLLNNKSELVKIKYSAVYAFIAKLKEKIEVYNNKAIFPYKLPPLLNKMKDVLT